MYGATLMKQIQDLFFLGKRRLFGMSINQKIWNIQMLYINLKYFNSVPIDKS